MLPVWLINNFVDTRVFSFDEKNLHILTTINEAREINGLQLKLLERKKNNLRLCNKFDK